jgi:acyl transferase domain-containing protein/3-hydroxymyristoyl/3-hydroxydecanoyl-(acyl carrier protein) dehydratase
MPVDFMTEPEVAIAIVGIGGCFAGSHSPDQLWSILLDGRDATSEVPAGRWLVDPAEAFDQRIALADHVYTTRGGFVDGPRFEPVGTGLDRERLDRLDPLFHVALSAATQAWRDARTEPIDRRRAGVVFGNIVLPTEMASALSRDVLGSAFEQALTAAVATENGDGHEALGAIEPLNAFPAGLPAAVVAEALGLGGVAFTLDAACGSSLYALKLAVDELRSGRADAMISGGVSRPDALYTQMGFSQLRALSPRGKAAPLDHSGDGLIVGEGAGMFVLKRLADAVSHGDQIYGIVAGIGLSNDVHGDLLAPDSEGQLRAMRRAYEHAGWSPGDVDLIECHATGTPRGDAVEIRSLGSLWGETGWRQGQCVLGSVKGNVGHALTAAGAAGLLKVLLALKHGVFPPTANFDRPAPTLGLDQSPFRILKRAEPWLTRAPGRPRRAAVSGFGFGGINAHVLIEEWRGTRDQSATDRVPRDPRPARDASIAIVGIAAQLGPIQGKEAFRELVLGEDAPRGESQQSGAGYRLTSLEFPVGEFRIPPKELGEMLPQQSLMLRVAAASIRDSWWDPRLALRTGVLIGIGLDLNTTNFHLRWSLPGQAREWNQKLGLDLSPEALAHWIGELRQAAGPALTANRTMGSLGGLVASRIAREFRIGGPSFTVSCDQTSGNQALAIAVEWLRCGELDAAIVGAVDFASDPRSVQSCQRLGFGSPDGASDMAVSLVLKRLEDAQRDGDRVYAVIREFAASRRVLCEHRSGQALVATSVLTEHSTPNGEPIEAQVGAAAGLASVAKAALCLHHQILPGQPVAAQFWLRNRADGPRRVDVGASSLGGNCHHVILEESPSRNDLSQESAQPLVVRRLGLFAIEADDTTGLSERIRELAQLGRESPAESIDSLARKWWQRHPNDPRLDRGVAIVADSVESLERRLERLVNRDLTQDGTRSSTVSVPGSEIAAPCDHSLRMPRRVAFVYPGLGNQFEGMGRDLSTLWPAVLLRQESANRYLRDQLAPDVWWNGPLPRAFADHRVPILGQVSVGSLVTDVLRSLGLNADAAIGYSMGESAALVSLRAWPNRDEMFLRLRSSPLFESELAGPCHAARRVWGILPSCPVEWVAGIVPRSAEEVGRAIDRERTDRVYVLIKNTPEETVVGGSRPAVVEVARSLQCSFVELSTVSTVHCEIGRAVEAEYRALHEIETIAPANITFYSGVTGRPYAPDRDSAAAAIAAQATQTIDFPAVIERAYADGVGVFIEVGPGNSCTRLIDRILGTRPHVACSACRPDRDPLAAVLEVLSRCVANRLPVDLGGLYGKTAEPVRDSGGPRAGFHESRSRTVRVDVGLRPFQVPPLPSRARTRADETVLPMHQEYNATTPPAPITPAPSRSPWVDTTGGNPTYPPGPPSALTTPRAPSGTGTLFCSLHDAEQARLQAHRAYLRVAEGAADLIGKHLAFQFGLIEEWRGNRATQPTVVPEPPTAEAVRFDRRQCLELAVGSVSAVFGPDFAEVDRLPVRVRLPDEPLMLVDRILSIEGTPRSLQGGRIVTEHVIQPEVWYLDNDRITPCIAMEAGQADLVLSGYLGVDFETRGQAMYRLLDATVTFHRGLPGVGEVIRYDIRITRFFRQGMTILFRFEFDASIAGEPILTMRDGCAGFFTPEELASGKGIVPAGVPLPSQSVSRSGHDELISISRTCLEPWQVAALRQGNLETAFGVPFDRLSLSDPIALPGGRMTWIHRVQTLDPFGGPAGLGVIQSEADIHPGDWFMVCHFIDDRVMPGTLMYECCLHTLRIFMMRLGWIGRSGEVAFEPVPGIANRLRCRGQVTESTRVAAFEITIKERGYRPEPYAVADALIIADGKPIVAVTDLALQLSGTSRDELERLWRGDRGGE